MNKIGVPINDDLDKHLAVGQLWELTRIETVDGVKVAIFIEAAQQSALPICDHTCKNCGSEMQLVCFSARGT